MSSAEPGWYHAEGDPSNTERYWDGTQWTDGPRPIVGFPEPPSAPPVPPQPSTMPPIDSGSPPPISIPTFGGPNPDRNMPLSPPGIPSQGLPMASAGRGAPAFYPESSSATTALVLSCVGLFCCGLSALAGIYVGRKEQKGIQAGLRDPSREGMATAAVVIGVAVVALWMVAVGFSVLAVAVGAGSN